MALRSDPESPEVEFRISTLRTGVWPSLFVVLYLGVYVLWTWEQPHRTALTLLTLSALVLTLVIAALPLERWIRGRGREPFFLGWTASLLAMIATGCALDGGAASPLVAMLFLPLAYSALSYPLASTLAVGVADVLTYVAIAAVGGGVPGPHAFIFAGAIVNATWICGWQSRNHGAQRRELARVSRSDALTGTLNRRGFEERFEAEIARARRDGGALALVVLDLDDFKAINDEQGHAAGDALLCRVVTTLNEQVRATDAVGRLGGDEFGVLVVGGEPEIAMGRIQQALGAVAPASSGMAVFPVDGLSQRELHQAADADLYVSKHGRRRPAPQMQRELSWAAALAGAVDDRMSVTHEHGEAVAELAAGMALRLGWAERDLDLLRLAAMLHDVGKIHVPEHILRKAGPLDESEWAEIRKHPASGADIVASVEGLEPIVAWIRHSHEHVDGRGYPDKLRGDAIPQASRILLVADAFDAMTSDRSYRRALDQETALAELRANAGTHFDPACVAALEEHLHGLDAEAAAPMHLGSMHGEGRQAQG
jgi:diguanylate cyclase (GGDEF)-like protein/putative nucleotidyltransferase with HDIG domain